MASTEPAGGDRKANARTPIGQLTALRQYAATLRAAAAELAPLPDDTARLRLIDDAQAAVTFADGPMTIGLVGEYNAGKSLMLGMLLDEPELLPVGDDPMTANVTALRLLPAPPGVTRTRIGQVEVEYLTRTELAACTQEMVTELAALARDAHLGQADLDRLRAAERQPEALQEWCGDVGWPRGDADLRAAIAELIRLQSAARYAAAYLDQPPKAVTATVVKKALTLPRPDTDPSAFPSVAPPAVDLSRFPGRIEAEHLAATLPLVRRVTMDVEVPASVWDISALRGHNELTLLDFPGLDASISGVRDRYLSRRELAEIPTILVLLNAAAGARKGPNAFVRMMQRPVEELRHAVLVGIGRFDQLPGVLPALMTDPPPDAAPLRERDLEPVLGTVLSAARGLVGSGRDRRVVPFSSMAALDALERRTDGARPWSDTFAAERDLATNLPPAVVKAKTWLTVGQWLQIDDPQSELGPALVEFGRDGGVARLRALLEQHVLEHGVQERLRRMRERVRRLDGARLVLVDEVRAAQPQPPSPTATARRSVDQLIRSTTRALEQIERRARAELPDPRVVRTGGRSLAESAQQQAAELVFDWPLWGRLFDAVGSDGMVTPPAPRPAAERPGRPGRPDRATPAWRRRAPVRLPIPVSVDEFDGPFTAACTACADAVSEDVAEAYRAWHGRVCTAELSELTSRWAELLRDPATENRLAALPEPSYLELIDSARDLSWLADEVADALEGDPSEDVDDGVEPDTAETIRAAFPAQRGMHFTWDPDTPAEVQAADTGTKARHQIRPLRLRREFANAVSAVALNRAGDLQQAVVGVIVDELSGLRAALSDSGDNRAAQRAFVDAVVDAPQGGGHTAPPDPAEGINRLQPPTESED